MTWYHYPHDSVADLDRKALKLLNVCDVPFVHTSRAMNIQKVLLGGHKREDSVNLTNKNQPDI